MNQNQNQNIPLRNHIYTRGRITLRTIFRVSRGRRARLRARGRRCERRLDALGTPVMARRPGPVGPRASIMESTVDEVDGEHKSEYSSTQRSIVFASSISISCSCRDREREYRRWQGRR